MATRGRGYLSPAFVELMRVSRASGIEELTPRQLDVLPLVVMPRAAWRPAARAVWPGSACKQVAKLVINTRSRSDNPRQVEPSASWPRPDRTALPQVGPGPEVVAQQRVDHPPALAAGAFDQPGVHQRPDGARHRRRGLVAVVGALTGGDRGDDLQRQAVDRGA